MLVRTTVGLALVAVPGFVLLSVIDATFGATIVALLSVLTVLVVTAAELVGVGHTA